MLGPRKIRTGGMADTVDLLNGNCWIKKRWFKQRIRELSYGAGPTPPYFLQIGDKGKKEKNLRIQMYL